MIDNGERLPLVIDGVFDGVAGVADGCVSFIPNRDGRFAAHVTEGLLDGRPVRLTPRKEKLGPFWTARYEPLS